MVEQSHEFITSGLLKCVSPHSVEIGKVIMSQNIKHRDQLTKFISNVVSEEPFDLSF